MSDSDDDMFLCCVCCTGLIGLSICMASFASVGIAELIMVGKYGHEIVCNSSVMSLQTWLVVDGIVNIVGGCILGLLYFGKDDMEQFAENARKINKPFIAFELVWTIIGSIVFWRDCPHVTPHSISDLMYAVLILSYIRIYTHYDSEMKYTKKKHEQKQKQSKPALQINLTV